MSAAKVIRLLRENPAKVSEADRAELRRLLDFDREGIIDLWGLNMEKARKENRKIRRYVSEMYDIAKENAMLLEFLHAYAAAAMRVSTTKDLGRAAARLVREFGLSDGFALAVASDVGDLAPKTKLWARLRAETCVVAGRIPLEFKECLGRAADRVRSHVMVRIGRGRAVDAVAVFYSFEPGRFSEEGGNEFLGKFAELTKARIDALRPKPAAKGRRA